MNHRRSQPLQSWLPYAASALFVSIGVAYPERASAQLAVPPIASDQDREAALREFNVGRTRFEQGRFTEAATSFLRSLETVNSPTTRLHYARALRGAGQLPRAADEMRSALEALTARAAADPRNESNRAAAETESTEIEQLVGRVVPAVTGAPADHAVRVRVGGEAVDPSTFARGVAVMPGRVEITVESAGSAATRATVEVAAGHRITVPLALSPLESRTAPCGSPGGPECPIEARDPAPVTAPRSSNWLGIGVAGLAVASFGTGIALQIAADNLYREVMTECTPFCDPSRNADLDRGRAMDIAAWTTLGIGVGLGLVSIVILGLDHGGRSDAPRTRSASTWRRIALGWQF